MTAPARRTAHPRSRGENYTRFGCWLLGNGSSPLTRGKRGGLGAHQFLVRLIPAHAGKTGQTSRVAASAWAHPRSRGENGLFQVGGHGDGGSSPLTRGKLRRLSSRPSSHWLIPAHAGKTRAVPTGRPWWPAHPRSRGENRYSRVIGPPWWGSSPLTRGKLDDPEGAALVEGLIPAHAGKTKYVMSVVLPGQAHPRSRGENMTSSIIPYIYDGSSPLTRGKLVRTLRRLRRRRLIPAHAGKTQFVAATPAGVQAHPRSRGENGVGVSRAGHCAGSSPLTRGKRGWPGARSPGARLIPAHAGKTYGSPQTSASTGAHPRSRGENLRAGRTCALRQGSSPLTRGKPGPFAAMDRTNRLIPAHAGKTSRKEHSHGTRTAHPRSRGENTRGASEAAAQIGSSPLTRGKPVEASVQGGSRRLIPAHAGKTLSDLRFYRADRSDLGKP